MNDRRRQMIKLIHKKYNKKSELLKTLKEVVNDLKIYKIKYKLHYIIEKDSDTNV